jgi:hypothetical protein
MGIISSWIIAMLIPVSSIQAQGWRGLVPLHSGCEDAKKVLGVGDCRNTTVALEDVTVAITFSDGTCRTGWRVSSGTILTLDVHPKAPPRFSDLHVDRTKYKRVTDPHLPDVSYYENKEEGVSIAMLNDDRVSYIFYGPSAKGASLECEREARLETSQRGGHGSLKFDEYTSISMKEEEQRLDIFVKELRSWPTVQGYVISYGRNRKERQARAARIREYIVKGGIKSSRVFSLDGGGRQEPTVELFLVMAGTEAPRPSPDDDPD